MASKKSKTLLYFFNAKMIATQPAYPQVAVQPAQVVQQPMVVQQPVIMQQPMYAQAPPQPQQTVIVQQRRRRKENYCGPISWIIGIFVFPCICFCPVDEREY